MNRAPRPLLVLGIVLVALTLRPVIAGFGPLLPRVQAELHASAATMSLLTTIPLVCWGIFALVTPRLTRWRSPEVLIGLCTALIALGTWLRTGAALPPILLGTVLVGVGIAIVNVLLPSLLRRDFPRQLGLMTGLYSLAVVGGAALASALAVPLERTLGGWRGSLGVWAWLSGAALLAWVPAMLGRPARSAGPAVRGPSVWSNPATLPVTLYMGTQSLVFFTWLTWLARLLQDRGLSAEAAGALLSLGNLVQLPFTLSVPVLASRLGNVRPLVFGLVACNAAGLLGLTLWPTASPLPWVLLLGAGAGSAFPLALHLIAVRARDAAEVPRLSATAQGFGYLLAASGPFLFGALHDLSGGWSASLSALLVGTAAMLVTGLWAAQR